MDFVNLLNGDIWGGYKWICELEKRHEDPKFLEKYGYKVYSQNDEDGIINEIFNRIGTKNKTFIEFGVSDGLESNCHSLLLQGWSGLWIEGREVAYQQILRRFAPVINHGNLSVLNEYVTRDSINETINSYVKGEELDILSIDVDGNDYHIWNAVKDVKPRVIIIEYNGKFPPEIDWVMPYNKDHFWDYTDRQGASLKAFEKLGKEKGYQLVGTDISGINAFFVREDLVGDLFAFPATAENLYNPQRFNLKHKSGHAASNCLAYGKEGMEGVFEYYPDWNFLTSHGFWKVQFINNERFSKIRDYSGKLFLRWITGRKLKIYYTMPIDIESRDIKYGVTVCIDGDKHGITLDKNKGCFEVPLIKDYMYDDIVMVEFEVDTIFMPGEYAMSDQRIQGFAINKIESVEGC